jgi:hypothetical protein
MSLSVNQSPRKLIDDKKKIEINILGYYSFNGSKATVCWAHIILIIKIKF